MKDIGKRYTYINWNLFSFSISKNTPVPSLHIYLQWALPELTSLLCCIFWYHYSNLASVHTIFIFFLIPVLIFGIPAYQYLFIYLFTFELKSWISFQENTQKQKIKTYFLIPSCAGSPRICEILLIKFISITYACPFCTVSPPTSIIQLLKYNPLIWEMHIKHVWWFIFIIPKDDGGKMTF